MYEKQVEEKSIFGGIIELGFRFFLLCQLIMISLKLTNPERFQWQDVFWPYWLLFSVMIGVTLGFTLILFGKIYQHYFEENIEKYELRGIIWLFFLSKCFTINTLLFVRLIISNYDDQILQVENPTATNDLTAFKNFTLIYITLCLLIQIIIAIFYYNDLFTFFLKMGEDEEENVNEAYPEIAQKEEDQKKRKKMKMKIEKNPLTHYFPSVLNKISSTFFSLEMPTKKKTQQKKKNIQTAKSKSFYFYNQNNKHGNEMVNQNGLSFVGNIEGNQFHTIKNFEDKLNKTYVIPSQNKQVQKNVMQNESFIQKKPNQENADEQEELSCCICFDNAPNAVFMNCGHGGVCFECAEDVMRKTQECYLCRNHIQEILELDLNYQKNNQIKVLAAARLVEDSMIQSNSKKEKYDEV